MIGCLLSHLTVMSDALRSGYEIIWICEDDIEVIRDPNILSGYIKNLDSIVGRDQWDVLFTFRDYREAVGKYIISRGAGHRPNIDTRNQKKFNVDRSISKELRQVGSRFGTQSMIWTKAGMQKVLDFYKEYKVFQPYDMDLVLIPDLKMYAVVDDVVTNSINALSDLTKDNKLNNGF